MVVLPCQADSDAAELSPPSIPERKKRWAAKVKTGCATCRCVQMSLQGEENGRGGEAKTPLVHKTPACVVLDGNSDE